MTLSIATKEDQYYDFKYKPMQKDNWISTTEQKEVSKSIHQENSTIQNANISATNKYWGYHTCERCDSRTIYFCLGCHRYLCHKNGADAKTDVPDMYSSSTIRFTLKLSTRFTRKLITDKTKSSNYKRIRMDEDINVRFNSICHLIAYRHLFEVESDNHLPLHTPKQFLYISDSL